MRIRGRRWVLGIALALLAAIALLIASMPHDRLLLEHATKIANTQSWFRKPFEDPELSWLSDHSLIYEQTGDIRHLDGGDYYLWDLNTGKKTAMPGLTGRILAFRHGNYDYALIPSPDGQWIAMHAGHHMMMTCRLDGGLYRERSGSDSMEWLPDSRHLVVETTRPFDEQKRNYVRRSVLMSEIDNRIYLPSEEYIERRFSTDKHMLQLSEPGPSGDLQITCFQLQPHCKIVWQKKRTWPPNCVCSALSPEGDRIAYSLLVVDTSPILQLVRRAFPHLGIYATNHYELWVSRIDGTHQHKIGVKPIHPPADQALPGTFDSGTYEEELHELQWLPDGKKLSFIYKDALYTIPAD